MPSDAPWLEVHIDLFDKAETKQLARALGCSLVTAGGHLLAMWFHAMLARPDGDLSHYSPEDLAGAARWEGDPRSFSRALKAYQWLDRDGRLHNWQHYTEHWRELRERTREGNRIRQARRRERIREASDRAASVTRDSHGPDVTVTLLTGPDRTGPNQTKPSPRKAPPEHARARANGKHDLSPPTRLEMEAPRHAVRTTSTLHPEEEP